MQSVNLAFCNNQNWFLPIDVSQYAAYYDLTAASFRMQLRAMLGDVLVTYAFSSVPTDNAGGTITFEPASGLIDIAAPYADMRAIPAGQYVYDLQFEIDLPLPVYVVENIWSGTVTVTQGVTLT